MRIKFGRRPKFNLLNSILNKNSFYKFYFFFTLYIDFFVFCFFFFQTGYWENNKRQFFKKYI